ncbi:hypothetical protein PYW07_012159 [Mythimna separata]|uniref:Uncharacterized protein n=1 Tax=Mythimna separata TaxID=271217 RepID=A0AAD7YL51_MYTSE|nr:hypothetical protein PYW07_012159 [Mythimna separata]
MEGFCRGCLIKYDEPMELLQYTEKNRRLFVYSTGLQVKRNDTFTFQLCKDCFLNMKQACKFKKNCRTSDKRFRNYLALKDVGDPVDFCTFLKNSDDTLTFRLPMASGNSTPATQKCRDDDNESTCTSIRNFMTDILQGEEMPDTEARIIKEVIEEEADVLDDSLDSHWLQDDMSIDTDFRLDFSFSQFSTPRSVNDDHCYTPKQKEDQMTFDTINTEKQTKILKDFTNAFKSDENLEELCIFVGGNEKTESLKNLKELRPFGVDEIDRMRKTELDALENKTNLKELITDLDIDEIDGMDTSDSKTVESNEHLKELPDFGIEGINTNYKTDTNNKLNELCDFGKDDIVGSREMAGQTNKGLKELITNLDIEEVEGMGKSVSKKTKSNQLLKELEGNFTKGAIDDPRSDQNLKELCDFSHDSLSATEKADYKILKKDKSLKEMCDINLDSFEENTTKNRDIREICDFDIDDIEKSENNLDLPTLSDVLERNNTDIPDFDMPQCVIGSMRSNNEDNEASNSSINIEALLKGAPDKDRVDTPDFDIPKGAIGSTQSNNDASNSSINIEAFLKGKPQRDRIDTPDFDIPKGVTLSVQSSYDISNSSINIEAFLKGKPERDRIDTPDFDIPKGVIGSIPSSNDISNSSLNIEALLKGKPEKDRRHTPDFDIPKGVIGSIQSTNEMSNSSINALLKGVPEKDRIDTPDFDILKGAIGSIQSNNDASNSSINIEAFLKGKPERDRIDTPDFDIPKSVIGSIQSTNEMSNSSINIEALLKGTPEKERIDTPDFDIPRGVTLSVQSSNDMSNSSINIEALLKGKTGKDRTDTPDFDIPKGVILSIQSNNDVSNSSSNIEHLLKGIAERDRIDTPDFDIPKGAMASVQSNNEVSNSSINIEALLKHRTCSIDKNLEEALKNTDSEKFSLEELLVSPPVYAAKSAASTPTITNILFGENLDTTGKKIEQSLESYHEIFEEFFQNDTKEFDSEDIIRENAGFKEGDWKKPLSVSDFELANKENESKNIEMEIPIDDIDKTAKKVKTEPVHISHDEENDKFNIKYLYCKLCDIRYDTSRAFSVHLAKTHNIKIVKPRKSNIKNNKEVTKVKTEDTINIYDTPASEKFDLEKSLCKLCNIKYESNRALCIHFTKTHRIKIEKPKCVKVNKNHKLLCNHCGKESRDQTNFARHVKKCGQKAMVFECDRCHLEFTTQSHLERHQTCHTQMKKKKETGKEFVCTICGRILHKHYNFVMHMRRHTKDYSAQCEHCDKKFYTQADLNTHLRTHTGETPFSCKFCPKLFTRKDVLLRHVLIHLDERLFQCDYCNKKFIKKYDLVKHIRNESCRRVNKIRRKRQKTDTKEMEPDIPEEEEKETENVQEIVNVQEIEIVKEVVKDVTIMYVKGSDATIKSQLPFLETERSN